jgi:hypothetical protein
MAAETILPYLLVAQGAMGAVDTLLNHELIERLPHRRQAHREIGLHSIRETIYAVLFAGLGWFEWHGALALAIAALVVAEIAVTATDEWTENRIRVLPQNERVLHVFLTLNMGAIIATLVPALVGWHAAPTALVVHSHGWVSWLLAAFAAASAFWAARDFVAWRRLAVSSAHD